MELSDVLSQQSTSVLNDRVVSSSSTASNCTVTWVETCVSKFSVQGTRVNSVSIGTPKTGSGAPSWKWLAINWAGQALNSFASGLPDPPAPVPRPRGGLVFTLIA